MLEKKYTNEQWTTIKCCQPLWVQKAVTAEVPKSLIMFIHSFLLIVQYQYLNVCFSVEFVVQETVILTVDYGIQIHV